MNETADTPAAVEDDPAETAVERAIRIAGGVTMVANMVGRSKSGISMAKNAGRPGRKAGGRINFQHAIILELASGVPAEEICPVPRLNDWLEMRFKRMEAEKRSARSKP